jgi:ATP-binding cassette subfamily B protein
MNETTKLSTTDIRILLRSALWTLQYAWRVHKKLLLAIFLVTILLGLVPAALAAAIRGLVNDVEAVLSGTKVEQVILFWLGWSLFITLVETVGGFTNDYFYQRLQDELNIVVIDDILAHAARLDLAHFEDPNFQDVMQRAQDNAPQKFIQFIVQVLRVITYIIQMVTLTLVLAVIEPLIILVLLLIALPYLFFQWRLTKSRYRLIFNRVTKWRWTHYFVTHLTNHEWVPEVKVLGLAPLLRQRSRQVMVDFRDENRPVYWRIYRGSAVFATISAIAFFVTFARVVLRAIRGGLTIGDVAVYGGAMARLRSSLESTVTTSTSAMESALHIANLQRFFAIEPTIQREAVMAIPVYPGTEQTLCGDILLENVCFTYPGASQPTLRELSLHIRPGETVAIVGRNGAGKTTLVKLLARLYDPTEGVIFFDGRNLRDWPVTYLHQHVSFVFQQFGRYEAPVADNIAYGDWPRLLHDRSQIEFIARQAGIEEMVAHMPNGYDTFLGRLFGEYNLSGGQWQRIAIARAFARPAALLILDEPTSNLDAQAEYRIFSDFRKLAEGRTTILISHRFSTVRMADRILVMENGRIIESGTHDELISLGHHYAQLYDLHRRQMDLLAQGNEANGNSSQSIPVYTGTATAGPHLEKDS